VRVESLAVAGYRRLANHEVRFRDGLNLIAGPNNSGKTSLLQALAVLVGTGAAGHPGDNWARDQTLTGGASLEAVLCPSEDEWRAGCALLNQWEQRLEPGAQCELGHVRAASWPWGVRARAVRDPRGNVQPSFEIAGPSEEFAASQADDAPGPRLADLARCLGNAFYRRQFSRRALVGPVYLGGGDRNVGPTESQLVGTEEYAESHSAPGGRLGEYIHLMAEEQRAEYCRSLASVVSPEFHVGIQFDNRVARLRMTVQDHRGWLLDADWQGSGVQWAMAVLAVLYGPPWGPVLVDEIESSLHPDLAVRLVALVRDEALRLGKQVIATTHSDLVIADAEAEEIILMRQAEPIGLWAGGPPDDEAALGEALDALGVPAIGYSRHHRLGARVVVGTEGPTDARLLEVLAKKAGCGAYAKQGVVPVPLGGSDCVRRASESAKLMSKAHLHPRALVFVMDRDERPEAEIHYLRERAAPAVLHVLERREIENYLLDPEAIARVLSARARKHADDVALPLIQRKLGEMADARRADVRRRRAVLRLMRRDSTRGERAFARELEHCPVDSDETFADLLRSVDVPRDRARIRAAWDEIGEHLEDVWEAQRLALAPGRGVLRHFRAWCQDYYGYAPRAVAIAEQLAEVPQDLAELFNAIEAAARD
jgi:ABC-type cobalamin/Fe3+-siderophores transport system ATPase subunit